MAKKKQNRPRGINRATSFAMFWEKHGRAIRDRVLSGKDSPALKERKLMEAGYIGGWMGRRDRDVKARRVKP